MLFRSKTKEQITAVITARAAIMIIARVIFWARDFWRDDKNRVLEVCILELYLFLA